MHCDFDVIKPKNKLSKKTNRSLEMISTIRDSNKSLNLMLKKKNNETIRHDVYKE